MKLRRTHRSIDIITLIFCKKAAFFFSCLYSCHFLSIKSILIHEYQHESTRISTNQHKSDTSPTRVNTSPTWVNTSQHESTRINTNQHDSNTSQHEATRVQNRSRPWKRDKHGSKKRQNLTERCCGRLHLSGFRFLLKIYDQLNY